ncbi:hypothetical protein BCA37_10865 [Mycobacterium sp. djl-10]|nr:hypothetical protein BCA37_10865 [Mycobacterium sp. djl-10]
MVTEVPPGVQWAVTIFVSVAAPILVSWIKARADARKTRSEARSTDVATDLSVGDANIRGAREEADRAQAARQLAEEARDQCKNNLVQALDAMDFVLEAIETVLHRQRMGTITEADYDDLDETMDTARRDVRRLRP